MLQNPSKYHPNPFSHFLALHNSQAVAHNIVAHHPQPHPHHHALPAGAAAHSPYQPQQQYSNSNNHHHQQQQHHHAAIAANQQQHQHHHLPPQPRHPLSSPHSHAQQLIEAANTTLDVGKSFTIAAILGLQKSAIEHSRKEYSDAINLSLHPQHASSDEMAKAEQQRLLLAAAATNSNSNSNGSCNNNNNNSNNNNNNNNNGESKNDSGAGSKSSAANNGFHGVNNFNCDSSAAEAGTALVHRYLPSASVATTGVVPTTFAAVQSQQQQQQQQQQQNLVLSHVRAVATAAAVAATGGAPSALQSLQQLHQHHAVQQSSLSFQRDKHKAEGSAKKSALKNKRVRTIFTPEQLERLEAEFERQQYMVGPERLYLAHTLQLTEAQVKVWFQNRRIKWRKHHLEITQQRLALLRQNQLPTTSNAAVIAAAAATATSAVANSAATADATVMSSPLSCDADEAAELIKHGDELRALSGSSRPGSESDLSICNDSMDAESVLDGGEET